ncbi:HNH endonuclease [Acinetobacter baylyi]
MCGEGRRDDDPFTADHIRPRDPTSPLAPAHRSCNTRKSNRLDWRDRR